MLFFKFPLNYPADSPPIYQISAPWLKGEDGLDVDNQLQNVFLENIGEPVIFQWVVKLREALSSFQPVSNDSMEEKTKFNVDEIKDVFPHYPLIHGEPLSAGKCTFQGHVAIVKNISDIKSALKALHQIKKVANTTHNIYAYRIQRSGNIISDCDDDGETHAGSRMLHLLEILNASDVLVIVTRWFGGVHLGPARFQHINNAARQVLIQAQIICNEKKTVK
ncbi:protein IMPACT-A-like isoform X2 [Neocloeon triangulifer]|nr:protein IMPACT-A-like isoform X2 [Neocloeon triangulifer]XP_059478829.1 protein IMPACT-A-like isoform X2 [Neocloeon triangulifer]XP_059478830.1 protein IMPACT-A-like isoform X2 [Neocloeon triangulifer]XP_059478831.1 protein IMPACT-A-like isoform X2 [Neocloeon triangulifer]XP_059478832.1 protein IMPACT-A-like isoform X2 [Neocloeon triangulifer]